MATLLIISIFITFIGLGLPDSLFGPAWPAIYTEFGISMSYGSYITLLIAGFSTVSSLLSAKAVNRFGTGPVTVFSTALTVIGILGFSISKSYEFLLLCAIPQGLGAGAIDSALNNYVSLHYKASHMSFLHCFYGIGVSLSPLLISSLLGESNNWRLGYKYAFVIQFAILFIAFISLPLWKRVSAKTLTENEEVKQKTLSFIKSTKIPGVAVTWIMFITACCIEYTGGIWGSTFLVNTKNASIEFAARMIIFYYVGLALGRFLSGVLLSRVSVERVIVFGEIAVFVGIIIILLPIPASISGIGLFLLGLGIAPVFPNLIYLTPSYFGAEISQSVNGTQMAMAYGGSSLLPFLFGQLTDITGIGIFGYFLLIMFIVLSVSTVMLNIIMKRKSEG